MSKSHNRYKNFATGSVVSTEKVLLVGIINSNQPRLVTEEHLAELELLITTLGYETTAKQFVNQRVVDPAYFIGRGKAAEIRDFLKTQNISEIVFDDDLSPTQMRNLQELLDVEVRDRTGVILEIFASHAHTNEARTQIELATLEYLLPRLTRRWLHLERQIGGIGVRAGSGETQIETDRRLIKTRIAKLKSELAVIDRQRTVQSQRRANCFKIALTGYTNAGKSTILNLFTGSDVLVEDKLFATLDTTIRQLNLDGYPDVLLSDTIGFIRKLPHSLVASFRSTLREIIDADLIIKVADISSPHCLQQLESVEEVLNELGVSDRPSLIVFNKIDRLDENVFKIAQKTYPQAVFISALNQLRIDDLVQALERAVAREGRYLRIKTPFEEVTDCALIRNHTTVQREIYEDNVVIFEVFCYKNVWNWLARQLGSATIVLEMR
ncbi:MAG TPA: GTPase HflX [Candidatus Marinimicrobia bacterium]|nr:GTPase HflX [Candidatus Neomarinimicrobiota bacterium]HRS52414.1 GTPase HflX [Candidatus Neomarinimicrobiota bacterium]